MKIHGISPKLISVTSLTASIGEGQPFVSVAIVEGLKSRETHAPRTVLPGAVRLDQIPFPLLQQHDTERVIGRVDRMYRLSEASSEVAVRALQESPDLVDYPASQVWIAEGFFATNPLGSETAELVANGFMRGVSVGAGQVAGTIDETPFEKLLDSNEILPDAEIEFSDWQVVELSVVTKQAIGPSVIWLKNSQYRDRQESQPNQAALVASGLLPVQNDFLLYPKDEWFGLGGLPPSVPSHVTITEEGHVYAWLGKFNVAHGASTRNRKIFMPREDEGHTSFHSKQVLTASDKFIHTGVVTAVMNHAGDLLDARQTVDHYDHNGAAVADVVVLPYQNKGYVVSGSMRTTVSPELIRAIRGSNLSGDWRTNQAGQLKLRAVLAVNTAGFDPAENFAVSEKSLVASFSANMQDIEAEVDALLLEDEVDTLL